ncbi:hypothetical protein [Candidatus Neptunochlamydia vexilliferae]|nr:hypothetical protein [Candidatus Neptunochlamydia vexilliferae]
MPPLYRYKPLSQEEVPVPAIPKKPKEKWTSREYAYATTGFANVGRFGASLSNAIHGRPDSLGMQGVGMTVALGMLTGPITFVKGVKAYLKAKKLGDLWGKVIGMVNTIRGPNETLGALTFSTFRALSIAGAYTSGKALTVATMVFNHFGTATFGLGYIFLAIPSIIGLVKNGSFGKELAANPGKEIEILKKELRGSYEKRKAFVDRVKAGKVKDKDRDISVLTREDLSFLEREAQGDTELLKKLKNAYPLFKKGREKVLARKTGEETVRLIKELGERTPGKAEAAVILKQVKKEMAWSRFYHVAMLTFCIIGMTAVITGSIASGGTLGIIASAAWLATGIGMLGIDLHGLYKAWQAGNIDLKDKVSFVAMNALLFLSMGAGIALSGGLAPIIVGSIVSGIYVIIGGYSYLRWNQKEQTSDSTKHQF